MNAGPPFPFSSQRHASGQDHGSASSTARSRRRLPHLLAALVLAAAASHASADTVTEWNQTSIDVLKAGNIAGNPWSRCMAMVHVAIADAVNTIQGRYTRYAVSIPAASNASADAAAAAAARGILIQVYPGQKAKVEEAYAASLKQIPDGTAKAEGIAVGEQAAAVILADRANDATGVPDTYRPVTTPGVWVPTASPLFPEYARAKGWVITSADQFRPGPPPALTSALYARDYNETKEIGAAKSTKRTPQQTEAVRFWAQTNFGPSWNQAAREISAAKRLGLADNARLLALLNMGIANVFIADWDAKFLYNFWRPVTAIRNGDLDGNDATEKDAGWTSLNPNPMHPEYPSAAGIVGGVGAGILESVFGKGPVTFTVSDLMDPRLTRQFTGIAQLAQEQAEVRIWGGIHFRNSLGVGDEMGRKIAAYLVANSMKPAR
ncbi:MAG TPA: vanadium-dependent haloperoxidase [Methylomirabilota bacterium]